MEQGIVWDPALCHHPKPHRVHTPLCAHTFIWAPTAPLQPRGRGELRAVPPSHPEPQCGAMGMRSAPLLL